MDIRKRFRDFRDWCPQPPGRLPSKIRHYSTPLAAVLATTLILSVSFLVFSSSLTPHTALPIVPLADGATSNTVTDWPMFLHDPAHTGFSTSTAPASSSILWSFNTDNNDLVSSPSVVNGSVYVGSVSGAVYCVNAQTGAQEWINSNITAEVDSSPAVVSGFVYFGGLDGSIYCLQAQTGALKWNVTVGALNWIRSSPAVTNGEVYIEASDGTVYCLNANTGAEIWSFAGESGFCSSSPAVINGYVYVGSWNGNIYCLNASNGAQVWVYTTGDPVIASPSVAGGYVYVQSSDGNLYSLNASSGAKMWSYPTLASTAEYPLDSSAAVVNGFVYVGSNNGNVYCLNASTGVKIWVNTGFGTTFSPAVAGGFLYIGSDTGNFYCIDASNGATVWSVDVGASDSAAVANGVVYVGTSQGIVAFGTPSSPIASAKPSAAVAPLVSATSASDWPMFQHDSAHSGVGTGNPVLSPSVLWKINVTNAAPASLIGEVGSVDTSLSAPAIVDGVVYICAGTMVHTESGYGGAAWGDVYALNASNGAKLWDYRDLSSDGIAGSSPAIVDNVVFYGFSDYIGALNATNGASLWNYTANSGLSSPTVVNGVVYIGLYPGYVSALNATNGNVIWLFATGGGVDSSPAIINGVVYAGSFDGNVYALNATNGHQLWSYSTIIAGKSNGVLGSPAVVNGVVYLGSFNGCVYALNAANGKELWSYSTSGLVESSPVVSGGVVYVASNDGNLYALNAADGGKIWNTSIDAGSPILVGGVVYANAFFGNLSALNAINGKSLWNYTIGDGQQNDYSTPAFANGVIYIGSDNGLIYALTGSPALLPSSLSLNISIIGIAVVAIIVSTLVFIILKKKSHGSEERQFA